MRAITVSEYGASPSVTELPRPQPGPGQVLIAVQAAGMNPMDMQIADGGWKDRMPATFPMVLGADLAGIVEGGGPGAIRFAPGDAVFGQLLIPPLGSAGTYAQYVAVSADAPLARVPAGLDPVTAAALPTAGGTAMAIAESLAPLEGRTVLIVGASGGVGSFLTQLAAGAGAHVDASAPLAEAGRMKRYGAAETIDRADAAARGHRPGAPGRHRRTDRPGQRRPAVRRPGRARPARRNRGHHPVRRRSREPRGSGRHRRQLPAPHEHLAAGPAGRCGRGRDHRGPADYPAQPRRSPCAAEQARPRRRKDRNHHMSPASQPQFLNSLARR